MSWVKAVWNELGRDGEKISYEDTVPSNWIKGKKLYWPNHLNAKRSFWNRDEPNEEWDQYELVKAKLIGNDLD